MDQSSREAWDQYFKSKGYGLQSTDSVLARKDALRAVWVKHREKTKETWESFRALIEQTNAKGNEARDGNIPKRFSDKSVRRAMQNSWLKGTQFDIAWSIAVVLEVRVEEIFVLDRQENPGKEPSFTRREVTTDLALWTNSLFAASLAVAVMFLIGVGLDIYDPMRGGLPLIGTIAVATIGALSRRRSTFPAPRTLQLALGALFGNLSAVASYISIALIDSELMCDFANQQTMLVVFLYMLACVFAYPAGQAVASEATDEADKFMIAGAVVFWLAATVSGFALPEITCAIVP